MTDDLDVIASLRWRAEHLRADADRIQADADAAQTDVNRKREQVTALRAQAGATYAAANVLDHAGFAASIHNGLLTIRVEPTEGEQT